MASTRSFLAETAVKAAAAPWQAVAIVTSLAAVLRIVAVLATSELRAVEYEYGFIANHLLAGDGYAWAWDGMGLQPTSLFPPGYVLWVAALRWLLGGDHLVMYLAQATVAATGCVPAYLIGRTTFGPLVGLGFALGYAVYPDLVVVPAVAVPEFLSVVLALWMMVVTIDLVGRPAGEAVLRHAAILGVLAGVGLLVRESAAIVAIACGLRWMWAARLGRPRLAMAAAVAGVIASALVAPWMWRNWQVQHEFIPIRTGYGYNLWVGNHPGATGTNWARDGRTVLDAMDPEYREALRSRLPPDEQDRDRAYRDEARRLIREDPGRYLRLTLDRVRYLAWFDPTYPYGAHPLHRMPYLLLLVTAVPGLVGAARAGRVDPIFWWIIVGTILLYVPVMVMPRYRLFASTLLLLFSARWMVRAVVGDAADDAHRSESR